MAKKKAVRKTQIKTNPKPRGGKRKPVGGPFLIGALFCERILKEESVASIIRVVDKFTIEKPTLPAGVRAGFSTSLFISFKSGDFTGTKTAKIKAVTPSGSTMPEMSLPVVFKGEGSGPSLHIEFAMALRDEGLHWIEIYLDNQLMTKTPLDVAFTKQEATAQTLSSESQKKS